MECFVISGLVLFAKNFPKYCVRASLYAKSALRCLSDAARLQDKYKRKKAKKYMANVTVVRPTARALAETHFARGGPGRTGALRADALALLLSFANVGAGARVLLADGCAGLVAGASRV